MMKFILFYYLIIGFIKGVYVATMLFIQWFEDNDRKVSFTDLLFWVIGSVLGIVFITLFYPIFLLFDVNTLVGLKRK